MRMREGVAGYGVYWMLLEMLRDAPGYQLFYFPESFAFSINCPDISLVERVCKEYGLFEFDDKDNMSSPWLCGAMAEYDERKSKLREAGRRGAAHRWWGASQADSKPIATPSQTDRDPLAHDVIPFNVTQDNFTLPLGDDGKVVKEDYVHMLAKTSPEGHNPGYVAQVCLYYGMKESTCDYICENSDNANLSNAYYKRFCAIVKRIQAEKWHPSHPDGFFLKKTFQ